MLLRTIGRRGLVPTAKALTSTANKRKLHHYIVHHCSDEALIERFLNHFNKPDIDGWDLRQGMNDLIGLDMVPNPELCSAVLCACRRVNDYAIAIRFLEAVKNKCGPNVNEIYPYIIQEIRPIMNELGVDTPEELGYDVPELCLESVYDIH